MSETKHTELGCEVVIVRDGKILLGKRKNCYGAGSWGLPGGHLEFNERLVDCICREIKEELGATVKPVQLKLVGISEGVHAPDGHHHVHATFELKAPEDFEPKLMEPERCEEWRWFSLNDLPLDNFFIAHRGAIENYLAKRLYTF
ncbi:MAG TPA: NUDIX domain-containing protein [Candidatus Saccharimonadales bacterium]